MNARPTLLIALLALGMSGTSVAAKSVDEATTPPEVDGQSAPTAEATAKRHCVESTGTRIRSAAQRCGFAGQVYTREDLQRSGGMDIADSLSRLDPRIGSRGR